MKFGGDLLEKIGERLSRRVPLPVAVAFLSLCLGVGVGVGMTLLFRPPAAEGPVTAAADGKGEAEGRQGATKKARPYRPPRVVFRHGPPQRKGWLGEQSRQVPSGKEEPPAVAATDAPDATVEQATAPPSAEQVAALTGARIPPVPDDRLPWRLNAVKVTNVNGRAMIAVVIDDMGLDRRRSARAVALPGPLTLAYLPYGSNLRRQTEAARAAGHELLVHVSMEPESVDEDPGPNALIASLGPKDIVGRLRWALGRFDGYVGISNHMGSKFTGDAEGMSAVAQELNAKGLLFLDSRTTRNSVAIRVARRFGVPHARRHVFLDNEPLAETVRRRLREAEVIATHTGFAVAIGHPRDATLEVLEEWLPDVLARGFALAPISAIALRERAGG